MPNGNNKKYFIDSHIHLFNIDHIPIYTLLARLNLDLIKFGALFLDLNKLLREFKHFIKFFERDIFDNIDKLTAEIDKSLSAPRLKTIKDRERILTPLIMDFQMIPKAGHEKLKSQTDRLLQTLRTPKAVPANYKILPFLGLDLRRFDKTALNKIETTVNSLIKEFSGGLKSKTRRKNPADLENGDIIGIKLYPPLGFDPYPDTNNAIRKKYLAVFRHLRNLDLPITIHCQKGSYHPDGVSDDELKRYTTPINWANILNEEGLGDLRINLAHFGGDDEVKDTVDWENQAENVLLKREFDGLKKSTWTFTIIRLLKKHPNTYADISAFNYRDDRAKLALVYLIALDHNEEFDKLGPHRLADKLLWGSDFPMPIREREFNDYEKIMSEFSRTIDIKNIKNRFLETPKEKFGANKLPDRNSLLESLTHKNPMRFLFGD